MQDSEVEKYIADKQAEGVADEVIKESLREAGWPVDHVENFFVSGAVASSGGMGTGTIIAIIVTIIVVLVGAGLYLFMSNNKESSGLSKINSTPQSNSNTQSDVSEPKEAQFPDLDLAAFADKSATEELLAILKRQDAASFKKVSGDTTIYKKGPLYRVVISDPQMEADGHLLYDELYDFSAQTITRCEPPHTFSTNVECKTRTFADRAKIIDSVSLSVSDEYFNQLSLPEIIKELVGFKGRIATQYMSVVSLEKDMLSVDRDGTKMISGADSRCYTTPDDYRTCFDPNTGAVLYRESLVPSPKEIIYFHTDSYSRNVSSSDLKQSY